MPIAAFPPGFRTEDIETNGTTLFVRVGGRGPAVVLLHGFADTGDLWAPLAAALAPSRPVIVPDLRGMGRSARPDVGPHGGYDKKNQAGDIAGVLDRLGVDAAAFVTHDIGNMVGFAFAAQFRRRVTRWAVLDAPLPGLGTWDQILRLPMLWHFNFRGPDVERLVAGRERIYLDRFWNELSARPAAIDEETRAHYAALYAQPGAMHAAFRQFEAFAQDALDNPVLRGDRQLDSPVLAVGGEKSFGSMMASEMRSVADRVVERIIPDAGHWLMEEQRDTTVKAVAGFLSGDREAEAR